jgi:hypothetical protein
MGELIDAEFSPYFPDNVNKSRKPLEKRADQFAAYVQAPSSGPSQLIL